MLSSSMFSYIFMLAYESGQTVNFDRWKMTENKVRCKTKREQNLKKKIEYRREQWLLIFALTSKSSRCQSRLNITLTLANNYTDTHI